MSKKRGRIDTGLPSPPPKRRRVGSYLADETFKMEQDRREKEQKGHSQLAKVNVVEHQEPQQQAAPEGELQNNIREHPLLDSQLNDGAEPNESRVPNLSPEAEIELENAKREQELQHRMKLGLAPGTAPKFNPPGVGG